MGSYGKTSRAKTSTDTRHTRFPLARFQRPLTHVNCSDMDFPFAAETGHPGVHWQLTADRQTQTDRLTDTRTQKHSDRTFSTLFVDRIFSFDGSTRAAFVRQVAGQRRRSLIFVSSKDNKLWMSIVWGVYNQRTHACCNEVTVFHGCCFT